MHFRDRMSSKEHSTHWHYTDVVGAHKLEMTCGLSSVWLTVSHPRGTLGKSLTFCSYDSFPELQQASWQSFSLNFVNEGDEGRFFSLVQNSSSR